MIKDELLKLGMKENELDSHESDLYVKYNDISKEWVKNYKYSQNVKMFRDNINNELWYEIPFGNMNISDPDAIRELELYIINTGELYKKHTVNIIKNLANKYQKGIYNHQKALKSWLELVKYGMKHYQKEHGTPTDKWYELLNTTDRQELAKRLQEYYFEYVKNNSIKGDG